MELVTDSLSGIHNLVNDGILFLHQSRRIVSRILDRIGNCLILFRCIRKRGNRIVNVTGFIIPEGNDRGKIKFLRTIKRKRIREKELNRGEVLAIHVICNRIEVRGDGIRSNLRKLAG